MSDIDISLYANNSSGWQKLVISRNPHETDEYYFTLTGRYRGETLQVYFDEIDKNKLEEIKIAIELILEDK